MSAAHGYETDVYDVGDLGYGTPYPLHFFDNLPVEKKIKICLTKPSVVLEHFENDGSGETLVYLDGDAFILDNIDEIEDEDYDVGLTYKGGRREQYVNAGVFWLRPTDAALAFMYWWRDEVDTVYEEFKKTPKHRLGDNIFLNQLVWRNIKRGSKCKGLIRDLDGVKVKFFDNKIYNGIDQRPGTKIVHFRCPHSQVLDYLDGVPMSWE
jgi:hypothetical protein